jgi:RHS repeat-associated protein
MAGINDKAIKNQYAENKYRYNGKELQNKEFTDGTGLEEYDFGLRFQDPQLGVWHNADPLAERSLGSSPYRYALDNPIMFIDPNGAYAAPVKSLINVSYGPSTGWEEDGRGSGSGGGGGGSAGGLAGGYGDPFQHDAIADANTAAAADGTTYVGQNAVNYLAQQGYYPSSYSSGTTPTATEAALMSAYVYGENVTLQGGWRASSLNAGLQLNDDQSGYQAQLFEKIDDNNNVVAYCLAFAGTNDLNDVADIQASLDGNSVQYQEAVSDAMALANDPDINVAIYFTGHSLGGGLAAAAAMQTGFDAITFDAMGVPPNELSALGLTGAPQNNITAFIMNADPVNIAQIIAPLITPPVISPFWPTTTTPANGIQIFLNQPSSKSFFDWFNPIYPHEIDTIIKTLTGH